MLCDFKIQKDHRIDHNKPDIVVLDRQSRSCLIIVVACPFDTRVTNKEQEKVENYQDLKREIERVWNCHEVKIIPIIIRPLGTVPKGHLKGLEALEMTSAFDLLQKAYLLGSARIRRKVLDT